MPSWWCWHPELGGEPNKYYMISFWYTLPETSNIAPENGWLEDDPFLLRQKAHFQVLLLLLLLVLGRVRPRKLTDGYPVNDGIWKRWTPALSMAIFGINSLVFYTLLGTNISPQKGTFEDDFPKVSFLEGISFREGNASSLQKWCNWWTKALWSSPTVKGIGQTRGEVSWHRQKTQVKKKVTETRVWHGHHHRKRAGLS